MTPFRHDYFSKTLAGLMLGLGLALSLSSLLAWITGDSAANSGKNQVLTFLLALIWTGTFSCAYFFSSGRRAWGWLGLANLVGFAGYYSCRFFAG